ncbi:hypothetical protein LB518_22975 [Mesorhizobium sp. BR1-1-16]|uniref:hypothetical protein n=1 Tax=Mesorhizobium sp. BR1-1-16 TaxID=2876653 RepID=UPI001CCDE2B8|nr:hypothetical protein [Mesorhizobium sp. BR1-1-16]MBZ9939179.1 hypothetical protein [Mesorhizobium sp. BR1-1-16]
MTHGDALLWLCIGLSALAVLSCIVVAAHRSFGSRSADRTEYDAYWRDGER